MSAPDGAGQRLGHRRPKDHHDPARDQQPGATGSRTTGTAPSAQGPTLVVVAGAGSLRGDGHPRRHRGRLRRRRRGSRVLVPDRLGRGESAAEGRLDLDREVEALRAVRRGRRRAGRAVRALVGLLDQPVRGGAGPAGRRAGAVGGARWPHPRARHDGLGRRARARIDAGALEAAQEWYMKDMPPEWLAGAKASPAWPAIYADVVSLRADGESLRWATAAAGVRRAARPGRRPGAGDVRQLHVPGDGRGGRADPVGPAADRGPRGRRRAPRVGRRPPSRRCWPTFVRSVAGPTLTVPTADDRPGSACSTRPSPRRRTGRAARRSGSSTCAQAGSGCGSTRSGSPTATAVGSATRGGRPGRP